MWVNVEFLTPINGLVGVKMNLANAAAVEEREDVFMLNFAGEAYYRVKKTPEMVEAYNSLVPVKSQPVVQVEPEEPFRITGLGLYRSEDGDAVKIDHRDSSDTEVPWRSDKGSWYVNDGCRYFGAEPRFNIVKLIKLDEVQP